MRWLHFQSGTLNGLRKVDILPLAVEMQSLLLTLHAITRHLLRYSLPSSQRFCAETSLHIAAAAAVAAVVTVAVTPTGDTAADAAAVTAAVDAISFRVAGVRMTRQKARSRMRAKGSRCLVTLTAACTTCKQTLRLTTRSKKRKGRSAWTRFLPSSPACNCNGQLPLMGKPEYPNCIISAGIHPAVCMACSSSPVGKAALTPHLPLLKPPPPPSPPKTP